MWNHIGCATANLWNDQFVFYRRSGGSGGSPLLFYGGSGFCLFRGCKWIIYPLYIANTAPRMLRDTAGEKGYVRYKPVGEMSFSIPPSLRATSPMANATQGRS